MTSIAKRLRGGDLRSIGDANRVARDLLIGEARVEEAIALMLGKDPGLRARSADSLEKAARRHPSILRRHKRQLLRLLATAAQQEVRWHLAQMLPLLRLTSRERQRVLRRLRGYLQDESRIVQVCALQALWDLGANDAVQRTRLQSLLARLAEQGPPSVRARARRLLRPGRRRTTS